MVQTDLQHLISSHQEPHLTRPFVFQDLDVPDPSLLPLAPRVPEHLCPVAVEHGLLLLPGLGLHLVWERNDWLEVEVVRLLLLVEFILGVGALVVFPGTAGPGLHWTDLHAGEIELMRRGRAERGLGAISVCFARCCWCPE